MRKPIIFNWPVNFFSIIRVISILPYICYEQAGQKMKLKIASIGILGVALLLALVSAGSEAPDGRRFIYSRFTGNYWQLWTASASGGDHRQITDEPGDKKKPVWLPGGQVVFLDNHGGLWSIDLEERIKRPLFPGFRVESCAPGPAVGELLLTVVQGEVSHIWMGNIAEGEAVKLTAADRPHRWPVWLPGNIVYVSPGRRGSRLMIASGDGKAHRVLLENDSYNISPSVSPDGGQLAFASNLSGGYDIWVAELAEGAVISSTPRRVTGYGGLDDCPRWSPPGDALLFVSTRGGGPGIWMVGCTGKKPILLTPAGRLAKDPWWEPRPGALQTGKRLVGDRGAIFQNKTTGDNEKSNTIISDIRYTHKILDLSKKQTARIDFFLKQRAKVWLTIVDENREPVFTRHTKTYRLGRWAFKWNGRDDTGHLAAPGVYACVLRAVTGTGMEETVDESARRKAVPLAAGPVIYNKEENMIRCTLPGAGRVRVRVGLSGGPLLGTLIDWQPFREGLLQEPWDGKDKSGLWSIKENPGIYFDVRAYSLAANSIIVAGRVRRGNVYDCREPWVCREPDAIIRLPEASRQGKRWVVTSRQAPVIIDAPGESRRMLAESRFQVLLFVDGVCIMKDRDGFLPYTYTWDASSLDRGDHFLTVNLVSYEDHVAINTIQATLAGF
jgi:hypothetical protein